MNLLIDEDVSNASLLKLCDAYNLIEKEGGQLHIFFNSNGGDATAGEAMIELINRYAHVTTITAYSFICSMGFDIMFRSECRKVILPTTLGMIHHQRWGVEIKDGGTPNKGYDAFKMKFMKNSGKERLEFYAELGVTEEEFELMRQGEDVWLDNRRLQKMLKKIQP